MKSNPDNGSVAFNMDRLSISINQLKANSAKAIFLTIEEYVDKRAVKETNFTKGRDFEEVTKELNIGHRKDIYDLLRRLFLIVNQTSDSLFEICLILSF